MRPSKWNCATVLALLLILQTSGINGIIRERKVRPASVRALRSFRSKPFWEDVLREFVFRSFSSSPAANHALYKGILDAPFYGGPFPEFAEDASKVLLSRGDVHHLPNGRWLMCQEGCLECSPCADRKNPTVKWTLRRIERPSSHNSVLYDLHVTIILRGDGYSPEYVQGNRSPWPRSYEYVTTQPEEFRGSWMDKEDPWPSEKYPFSRPVDGLPVWRSPEEDLAEENSTSTTVRSSEISYPTTIASITTAKSSLSDNLYEDEDGKRRTPHFNVSECHNAMSATQLILGTDYFGNKRMVHVVPAGCYSNLSIPSLTNQDYTQSGYRQLFELIFDSLNNKKEFIEHFLRDRPIKEDESDRTNVTSILPRLISGRNLGNRPSQGVDTPNSLQHIRSVSDLSKILSSHFDIQRIVHKRPQQQKRRPAQALKRREKMADSIISEWEPMAIVEKSLGNESSLVERRNETESRSSNETDLGEFNEAPMANDNLLESRTRYVPRGSRMLVTTESTTIERSRVVSSTTGSTNDTDSF